MPADIDAFDWSTTPLGGKAGWSPALRTTYDMMMGTGFAACAIWGVEQTLIYNAAYIPFLGKRHPDALGRPISEVWHDVWDDIRPLIDRALAGERVFMEDLHLVMTRNGPQEDTYWTFSYSPLRDGDTIAGMLDIAIETTGRVEADRQRALLSAETSHRLKNTLALVQAIARQSLRGAADRTAVRTFEQRLQALGCAHDVLIDRDWKDADLGAIVSTCLEKIVERDCFTAEGPEFGVSAAVAQNLSLVIHELATNALKHGALSRPAGRVRVTWSIADEDLLLDWMEEGGPAAADPQRNGFGTTPIRRGLTGAGGARLRYGPDGLSVQFRSRIDSLANPSAAR